MKLINQPLKSVGLLRPKRPPAKVAVKYIPSEDKYVKFAIDNRLYWKPF